MEIYRESCEYKCANNRIICYCKSILKSACVSHRFLHDIKALFIDLKRGNSFDDLLQQDVLFVTITLDRQLTHKNTLNIDENASAKRAQATTSIILYFCEIC